MCLNRSLYCKPLFVLTAVILFLSNIKIYGQSNDSLRFPINDRRGDRFAWKNKNPFDLSDTSYIKQKIEYDPKTNQYYIVEKVGKNLYRKPTYLTFEEYYKLRSRQSEEDYFKERANALTLLNKKAPRPKMRVYDKLFDRIFGVGPNGLKVDIKPQGSVDVRLGYNGQNTLNPTLPERARKTGGFDFNMNTNLNLNASIGDKLKLPINYNTLATFDYLNQLKLDYKGMDDEIIRSIEAGNISFQSKGTLIPSAQNLFGLKTQLQFGKLSITAALANQRSQQQTQTLKGGAALSTFQKKLSDYEENKHFLLAQYFRSNYNNAMSNLPVVRSQAQILRIEVWVTNRNGSTTDARDIVGLMDLGENNPYNNSIQSLSNSPLPYNGANTLYNSLAGDVTNRNPSLINSRLQSRGLQPVQDYEKTFARKLNPNEYYFNPQIGFLSLNAQLQPDDVLAVAYQYTYNGKVYQVGEFSQDVALDSTQGVQKVLFLKLLKATSARVDLPIWRLMMKNVYSLDVAGITRDGFQLNVMYNQPSGGLKRYLPEAATAVNGRPLLSILNLDRLNSRNDPQPDGLFDYVEGFTVLSQQGKIIFPVLEPFGSDLETLAFGGVAQATKDKYLFRQLYDSIKAIAQTYANLDRFVMQGQVKGSGGGDISLGAFNIPQGSVKVNAGGQILTEGVDYIIDYNLGTVKILNQAILNSGIPVNVSYENNAGFGLQQRGFLGLRLDYAVNKKLALGATMERLNERPFFTKMNYGEDPIRNTMYGADFSYKSNLPSLTRMLDKLPFYSTKTMSSITAYGEGAYFKPGHPPQIGSGANGLIYVDDFEGTRSDIDLRFPLTSWALASTPQGNPNFPEATLTDSVDYGKNRAKLAWYNIEPNLQDKNSIYNPLKSNLAELSDPRVRSVLTTELFPNQSLNITNTLTTTFDMAYYPTEPGPYNFESNPSQIDANGKLRNPKARWGGIMRAIDQTDFETNNFEFVEFWVQDPFIKNPGSTGGKLFLNLGSISEDILKDGRRFYENGLNTPNSPAAVDSTNAWGKTPVNPIQITQAFSNDPNDRPYQDVGFDGLDDDGERRKRSNYLTQVATNFGTSSPLYQHAIKDPSNDDYVWYRDGQFDANKTGILGRYKNYNNPQGNSPIATGTSQFSPAATLYPDNEDLNRDNSLNETEQYYEYEIDLKPGMDVGVTKYITDKRVVSVQYADNHVGTENWYLFRVPIRDYIRKVGNIPDFKSIRFLRMYMTDFQDSAVLRFAKLDLVRNQWRQFTYQLDTTGSYTPINNSTTSFNTLAVNIEENSSRTPVNYVIPPGIERVQQLSNNGINILQNEQSLSLQVRNLNDGEARGVFKTVNLDMRNYGKLSMFAHAESVVGQVPVKDNELNLVIRIGQDFLNNYYEIKIPLKITPPGSYSATSALQVWPAENNLDLTLQDLVQLKQRRNNNSSASVSTIYRELVNNRMMSVLGNPNLGQVTGILIAVENAKDGNISALNAEAWVDELRLSQINEKGAYAALGRVDLTLADLGKISVSANTYTQGWGSLESHINDRARDNMVQFDAAATLDAGKLVPKKARLSIPVYASINRTVHTPQYDPFDQDILYKDKLSAAKSRAARDSIRNAAIDQTTIKTINFTNVRVMPKGKIRLWSISNFDVSYSYTRTESSNPTVLKNDLVKWRAGLGYTYNHPSKYIEPFKKVIKSRSAWYGLVRDFNFNPQPSLLSFRADINRQMGQFIPRIINTDQQSTQVVTVDTTYDKYFTFDRYYNMRWDLARSLNLDFSATDNARIDEPYGLLNTKNKKDSVLQNFLKGGRNTMYQQRATLSYTLPLNKFPLTDWIIARYTYATSYNWIGASLLATTLGNTLENSQENNFSTQFDFNRLYAKSRWLRALNNAPPPKSASVRSNTNKPGSNPLGITILPRDEVIKGLHGKKKREALRKWRRQKRDVRIAERLQKNSGMPQLGSVEKVTGHLLTMVKNVSIDYAENYHSRVPGWMDSTQALGQNWRTFQPGLDYVFGRQPDSNWLNRKAAQGLITRDSTFNYLYRQNFEQKFRLAAQLEPIRELTIDVNFEKSFNKEYTELFKDSTNSGLKQQHLNPYASGGFSVSFISFETLFRKTNPNEVSATFKQFENNRLIISNRVAQQNGYWKLNPTYTADGYATGYGRYAQDVLIPSFLAAYTKKDPNTISLLKGSNSNIKSNPFSGYLPKPNWRLNYTGLSKVPFLSRIFSSVNITHAYSGTLSMNSFASALLYQDPFRYGAPGFIDTVSGNYIPFYLVPNITIQEQFSPLIGIDVTTKRQLNLKFEYKKSRQMSLSLIDYQLSETNSTEWVAGFNWKKRGLRLPFKLPGMKSSKLQNDLSLKLDLSMRNDATSNSRLDQANAYGTGGQRVVTIQPSIDYVYNNRINLKFFFDQRRVTPYISTSAPTIVTSAGVQVRVSLAP
ncbi:MAG: cell surface protein SprA [Bacteroidota bacterium]|nr:cell surface protein SprA [Bacteroidota bacterium]